VEQNSLICIFLLLNGDNFLLNFFLKSLKLINYYYIYNNLNKIRKMIVVIVVIVVAILIYGGKKYYASTSKYGEARVHPI
jgi:hypothetical protein